MDSADELIFSSLRSLSLSISSPHSKDVSSDALVEYTAKMLKIIAPSGVWPTTLPKAMAARFRICTNMATHITKMGFSGELGYNQFLYPTEADTRKILLFLVENLPRVEPAKEEEQGTASIDSLVTGLLNKSWIPVWLRRPKKSHIVQHTDLTLIEPVAIVTKQSKNVPNMPLDVLQLNEQEYIHTMLEESLYKDRDLSNIAALRSARLGQIAGQIGAVARQQIATALLGANSLFSETGSSGGSRGVGGIFSHAVEFSMDKSAGVVDDSEGKQEKREEERRRVLEEHMRELKQINGEIEELEARRVAMVEEIRWMEREIALKSGKTEQMEEEYLTLKKTFELLDDVDGNAAELKKLSKAAAVRQMDLAEEWEKRRVPIIEALRSKGREIAERKADCARKLAQIKEMRAEMKDIINLVREKDEQHARLVVEFNKAPKDVDRGVYTKRIMDIVKNVKRQNNEIAKIELDSKTVRKEINTSSEAMARAFGTADELIFKRATTDPGSKQAYKLLVDIHESFAKLVKSTEEYGQAGNAVKDLTVKIDAIQARNDTLNEERVLEDLKEIRKENEALMAKLGIRE